MKLQALFNTLGYLGNYIMIGIAVIFAMIIAIIIDLLGLNIFLYPYYNEFKKNDDNEDIKE